MRVSSEVKAETRQRILETASRLFAAKGFHPTSTRDLASGAGVAVGTVFNYFPSKEDLAMTIFADALDRAEQGYRDRRHGGESLREDLFARGAAMLRELAPFRGYAGEVLETALSPFASSTTNALGDRVRLEHLERVRATVAEHARGDGLPPAGETLPAAAAALYWALLLGVLAYWTHDDSPHQEDALLLLDESMLVFCQALDRLRHTAGTEASP